MSKSQNYIVVLGGTFFIIGVIIFGIVQFIVFGESDLTTQSLSFFQYVIPSIIATAFGIVMVLNLVEKKELKEKTIQSNEYAKDLKSQNEKYIEQLLKIEEDLSGIEVKEESRNRRVMKHFEEQDKKEIAHNKEHEKINIQLRTIEDKFFKHIKNYH